ncbi:MAG: M48 family metallopeptidase [Candidatus Omnitrophota bacterium]
MKYTAREIKGNDNISASSPVKDFFELIFKILGILLAVYIGLGFLVDYLAPRISSSLELKLGRAFSKKFDEKPLSKEEKELQRILENLLKHADSLPKFDYKVNIEESKQVNAFVLPGGRIVVLNALLKKVGSENEIAMVLGHELGHFAYRDHLRGLGRNLIALLISSFLFGSDSSISQAVSNSITNAEMRFSQSRERAADIYGLELLNKAYGNVSGATDFFEKMGAEEKAGWFFYIFASHPYPKSRVAALKEAIKTKRYSIAQKIPWPGSGE